MDYPNTQSKNGRPFTTTQFRAFIGYVILYVGNHTEFTLGQSMGTLL